MIGKHPSNICSGHKISKKVMKLMLSKLIPKTEESVGQGAR